MIEKLVSFALMNRFLIIAAAVMLFIWGGISFHNLPVDAYPDVADNYVNIITQWPGHSAEDIEKQITVPCEIAMAGVPDMKNLRSFSLAGISSIMMNFNDSSDNSWNRERVLERLSNITLPAGLVPQLQTDWSPVGQIYWYTIESKNPNVDVMEQKSLQDWVLQKQFKSVPGIVDVASFGGITKEYQIRLDPEKLISYGLSISQVEQQLQNNNANAGGSFIVAGTQQINVQAQGLYETVQQIEDTLIKTQAGTPIHIKDIAVVEQGPKIRLGQISKTYKDAQGGLIDNPDVVEGTLLLRKGSDADPVLKAVEEKVKEINDHILPAAVRVVPFLDRSDLVHLTTHTVLHNLTEGIILVSLILFFFLGNVRGALIVAITIPFALLFASICLSLSHIPANLLSLGALDFGMVVDGAVVMVENIVRHLSHQNSSPNGGRTTLGLKMPIEVIRLASHEVQRPVFFAIAIIITAYLPIFTLQSVEGRLFKPLAWTIAYALLGALIFSIVVAPVLCSILFRKGAKEWHNPLMVYLTDRYRKGAQWAIHHRAITVGVSVGAVAISIYLLASVIGSEFLPHLDEGAMWVRGTLAPSTGPDESLAISNRARIILASFPEVTEVVDQIGRPDDGTDWTGFFDTEYYVDLKPREQWRPMFNGDKDALIAAMNLQLEKIPGVIWGFSQPIEDNMEEAVSGVKGELSVKIYGDDFKTLEERGRKVVDVMSKIPGISDLGLFRIIGQPNLTFRVDREAAARFGINVADIQDAIQTAVGGSVLSEALIGEAQYDIVLRYQKPYRDTKEAIENVRLLSPTGERVSLAQLTKIDTTDGAEEIYREGQQRYIAVKYDVRNRDLGGAVEEAISTVNKVVPLPKGYHYEWAGEYQSKQRADKRLAMIVPLTVLLIAVILYTMFKSFKWAGLIMVNVALAPVGGSLALLITHTNVSVSSSVGFLALFGVSVQTGVIMLEYINQLRVRGYTIPDAAVEGAVLRLRPIMMTMLVATLGLLPAALSHGIGSDSQRPFAIVIVGGLIADLILSIFLLPTLYVWMAGEGDVLPEPEPGCPLLNNFTVIPLALGRNRRSMMCLSLCTLLAVLIATPSAHPQQALTWDQLKAKFEATNPALKADADNVDEMQAEEITAFLRPNPQVSLTVDGTQIVPSDGVWEPLKGTYEQPGVSYLHERDHKRELRLESAKEGTRITQSEHEDLERTMVFNLRTAFVTTLQAKYVLNLAKADLEYYDHIIQISRDRFNAGDLAQIDLDRIELLRVQYESEIETATVNLRTAKIQLLQMLNDRTPVDQFDVNGTFDFSDTLRPLEDFRQMALAARPDLQAALQTIQQSETNHKLAEANGSTDPTFGAWYTHNSSNNNPNGIQTLGVSVSIPLRIFDKNQGEKKRTLIDIDRSQQASEATRAQVFSDVDTAYELVRSNIALLKPYKAKYNDQALRVRDTVTFAYEHGGASLMDFLNAQSDYRQVQLAYAQLIGAYLTAAGQLNLAVGSEAIQ